MWNLSCTKLSIVHNTIPQLYLQFLLNSKIHVSSCSSFTSQVIKHVYVSLPIFENLTYLYLCTTFFELSWKTFLIIGIYNFITIFLLSQSFIEKKTLVALSKPVLTHCAWAFCIRHTWSSQLQSDLCQVKAGHL